MSGHFGWTATTKCSSPAANPGPNPLYATTVTFIKRIIGYACVTAKDCDFYGISEARSAALAVYGLMSGYDEGARIEVKVTHYSDLSAEVQVNVGKRTHWFAFHSDDDLKGAALASVQPQLFHILGEIAALLTPSK